MNADIPSASGSSTRGAVWPATELLEQIRATCDSEAPFADRPIVRGGEGNDPG
jgi:hypothetical protein